MIGDFPFYIKSHKTKIEIYVPNRIKDELKWMHAGKRPNGLVKSKKLEYRCDKVYHLPPGIGYIGSKYVYKHMSDLIGRSTFIKTSTQPYTRIES